MNKLAIKAPKYTIQDYVAFAAKKLGAPVDKTLEFSREVFPYYTEYAYCFADYICELLGIHLESLATKAIIPLYSAYGVTEGDGQMPGNAYRFWILNNKTDQSWREHPSKLPQGVRNMIDRYIIGKGVSKYYNIKPHPHISDSVWYFLFWVYLNYQASPVGRELFSLTQPFWPDLKDTMENFSIDEKLAVHKGKAGPGQYPVALEMNEMTLYEMENTREGEIFAGNDYAWFYDQEWAQDLGVPGHDEGMPAKEYLEAHGMTREQGEYRLNTGWLPILDPEGLVVVGDIGTCAACNNRVGCTNYYSSMGDFYGEKNAFIQCGHCAYDSLSEFEDYYGDYRFGHRTIRYSCPARILANYLDKGLTTDLVHKVVAKAMVDGRVVTSPKAALRHVQEKFREAPDLTRAFAIKLLKENTCIRENMFYDCKHIPREKALLWSGILNIEMRSSAKVLGGMQKFRSLKGV